MWDTDLAEANKNVVMLYKILISLNILKEFNDEDDNQETDSDNKSNDSDSDDDVHGDKYDSLICI